jgi:hypothetical protein
MNNLGRNPTGISKAKLLTSVSKNLINIDISMIEKYFKSLKHFITQ